MNKLKNLFYTGLASLVLLSSCEKPEDDEFIPETKKPDTEEPAPNPSEKVLSENTYIVSNPDLEKIDYYDYQTIGFTTPQDYLVGDIIAGGSTEKTPYGFLAKITEANQSKTAFRLDMNTTLDEAVKNAEGSLEKSFLPEDLSKSEMQGSSLKSGLGNYNFHVDINEVIYDADNNLTTTNDQIILEGYADFNIETNVKIKIAEGEPYANFESNFYGESNLELSTNLPSVNFQDKIPLQEYYFNPIIFTIGPVPVAILPKASLNFYPEANLKSKLNTNISTEFKSKSSLELKEGNWTLTKSPGNYFRVNPLESSVEFDANLSASLSPELSLELYGLAGPYANLKVGTTFEANTSANPWWTWNAWANANIGFDVSKLTKKTKNFEKTIPLEEFLIAQAEGYFPGSTNQKLDSIIIQPGPEGKDAWVKWSRLSNRDCDDVSDFYSGFGNDSIVEVYLQYIEGTCGVEKHSALIEFPSNRFPQGVEITSAKLDLYGHTGSNHANRLPEFNIKIITQPWEENSVSYETKPPTISSSSYSLPNGAGEYWNSLDVTDIVKYWNSGNENYGLEISTKDNESGGQFYSGDNAQSEKRPKLTLYYKPKD